MPLLPALNAEKGICGGQAILGNEAGSGNYIYSSIYQMSINWQQSRVHALNTSSTKANYAFPKSPRFPSLTKPLCESFYNISSNLSSRKGPGIGRGTKTTFADKNGFPSPLHYNTKSSFDLGTKKGVPIGLGRESIKYGGVFQHSETPDPGHYSPKDPRLPSPRSGYTMRAKVKEVEHSYLKNPGPGQYKNYSTISATGIYSLSTLPNVACPKIRNSRQYDPKVHQKIPGPGHYEQSKQNINKNGTYYNSRFTNSRCRTFSKSSHKPAGAGLKQAPGPGTYNYFSEFGARSKVL